MLVPVAWNKEFDDSSRKNAEGIMYTCQDRVQYYFF